MRRQTLAASCLPLRRVGEHPARSEDKRADLVGIPDFASPQPLDRHEKHLLREIFGGRLVAQVLPAVQSCTRGANRRYNSDSSACAAPGGVEAIALASSPSLAVERRVSALPRTSATLTAARLRSSRRLARSKRLSSSSAVAGRGHSSSALR